MSKRIAIAAIGTMGDVQPFVALGRALTKRGHSVVIATTIDFEQFVTSHGLEFQTLGTDIQAFLQSHAEPALRRSALASSFVAALELARRGALDLQQEDSFAPLYLRAKP